MRGDGEMRSLMLSASRLVERIRLREKGWGHCRYMIGEALDSLSGWPKHCLQKNSKSKLADDHRTFDAFYIIHIVAHTVHLFANLLLGPRDQTSRPIANTHLSTHRSLEDSLSFTK
jgi:hypothetical protein